jgi:hypothetical protein
MFKSVGQNVYREFTINCKETTFLNRLEPI